MFQIIVALLIGFNAANAKLEDTLDIPAAPKPQGCVTQLASLYFHHGNTLDSRTELREAPPCVKKMGEAAVTLIPKSSLKKSSSACAYNFVPKTAVMGTDGKQKVDEDGDPVFVGSTTLKKEKNLCEGERFADQLSAGDCSGVLVSENEILTAGHCLDAGDGAAAMKKACASYYVVFNFTDASQEIPCDQVYECDAVVNSISDDNSNTHDAVKFRLTQNVSGHTPATIAHDSEPLAKGTPLIMIGSPDGVPLKATSGSVKAVETDKIAYGYRTNLDSFTHSSGSGVYNSNTGELVGFLWDGEEDYHEQIEKDPKTGKEYKCMRATSFSKDLFNEEKRGEYVTPINALPEEFWPNRKHHLKRSSQKTLTGFQ